MTEAKIIGKGEDRFASAIQKYLASSQDISGLVTDRMVSPEPGEVAATYAGEFMQKVALAINRECDKAEAASRDPDVGKALKAAGCSEEMYLQMSEHPDYLEVSRRIHRSFVILPRWPMICRAMTKSAMHGDVAAARWAAAQLEDGNQDAEAALRQLQAQGPEGLRRAASELTRELYSLLGKGEAEPEPDALIRQARQDILVQRSNADTNKRVSARTLYGLDTGRDTFNDQDGELEDL